MADNRNATRSRWQALVDYFNEKRAEARDTVAFAVHNPGQGPADDPGARNIHRAWMRGTAQNLQPHLNNKSIYAVLDALGMGNEALSGGINWIGGGNFFDPKGYDQGDIDANREGLADALYDRPPAEDGPPETARRLMNPNRRRTY